MSKDVAAFDNFDKLDIRVGTVVAATLANTKKPTYRMTIDFGTEVGTKVSCGAYTNYSTDEIIGKQIIAVVNFEPKRMGPELSEALVLGVHDPNRGGTIFLTLNKSAPNGSPIF